MFSKTAALVLLVFSGCHSGSAPLPAPRQRLSDYISKSFNVSGPSDRNELLTYLTGDAKIKLQSWSDEEFRIEFLTKKRQFVKLTINEIKNISSEEMGITYELVYLDTAKGQGARITNKKLAQLKLESGKWMIAEVKSVKELVEYKNEMSLP